jgi:peptidoglycan/LPS O-acetylase OafA/YrhL
METSLLVQMVASAPSAARDAATRTDSVSYARAVGPDILRSLAILLVMLFHCPIVATPIVLMGVRAYGWLGVDVFFVLSGFLIGRQLFNEVASNGHVDLKNFYVRRAFRILPAFFVVLAIYAFVPFVREAATMQPVWRFATFTMNFGLESRYTGSFTQAWSLCVEEHFYLVLPLLIIFFVRRMTFASTIALSVAILSAGILLRFTIWQTQVGIFIDAHDYGEAYASYLRDIYYPTYNRLDGLMFGVLLAAVKVFRPDFWKRYAPPKASFSVGGALVAIALVIFTQRGAFAPANHSIVVQSLLGTVVGFPVFAAGIALILGGLVDVESRLSRWPLHGAALVATLSYSLYLTHKSVFHIDQLLFGTENLQGVSGFVIYAATSLVVAAVLWFLVERFFLKLRDRFLSPVH